MTKLKGAMTELQAALRHAEAGRAYYDAQIQKIQRLIEDLAALTGEKAPAKRGPKPKATAPTAATVKAKAAAQPAAKTAATKHKNGYAATVPVIGQDYWLGVMKAKPCTKGELAAAAIRDMKLKDDKRTKKLLLDRLGFQLSKLTLSDTIKKDGTGMAARYSCSAAQ